MRHYAHQVKMLLAVDCIIFGFDGQQLSILLIRRGFQPMQGQWSLMGGFIQRNEDADAAASRVVASLTGLTNIYLEQLHTFTDPSRDPVERTASIAYFALINLQDYAEQVSKDFDAQWIPVNQLPQLIFDHAQMIDAARQRLREKTRIQPLVFELLPQKFTLPQLQALYEQIYDTALDKRNFMRKIIATKLLIRQKDKDKSGSRRGAFYYRIDQRRYARLSKHF